MGFGKRFKRFAKRASALVKKVAPSVLAFAPGGALAGKALSVLKSSGVDMRRLNAAGKGNLVSAVPLSEISLAQKSQKASRPVALKRMTAKVASAPRADSAFVTRMKQSRADNALLGAALKKLDKSEQTDLFNAYKSDNEGYTWPQYVAAKLT